MTKNSLFEQALAAEGVAYLQVEERITGGGTASADELRRQVNHADPFARFLAQALLPVVEGRLPEFHAALEYLERLPARTARTPIGKPSPSGTAAYLDQHFADRTVDQLALRLVKQVDWPRWKVVAVLLHLQNQAAPPTNAALLRFASRTADEEARDIAVETVLTSTDPGLQSKLDAEYRHLQAQGKTLAERLEGWRQHLSQRP